MAHRRFQDEQGHWWDVWESRPTIIDRRAGRERRTSAREAEDRRQREEDRIPVHPDFRNGWLSFQCGTEWLRLAPIPPGWAMRSDAELRELLAQASARGVTRTKP